MNHPLILPPGKGSQTKEEAYKLPPDTGHVVLCLQVTGTGTRTMLLFYLFATHILSVLNKNSSI